MKILETFIDKEKRESFFDDLFRHLSFGFFLVLFGLFVVWRFYPTFEKYFLK